MNPLTNLGRDLLEATLGNAQTITLVPSTCHPVLRLQHADGSIEERVLGDVAVVPVIDMPEEIADVVEIQDAHP